MEHCNCQGFHILGHRRVFFRNVDSSFRGSHDDFVESGSYNEIEAVLLLTCPFGRVSSGVRETFVSYDGLLAVCDGLIAL